MAPFYTSANGPLAAGFETLIPIITVRVWFQAITQSSVMWDGYQGAVWTYTYPTTKAVFDAEVHYDNSGSWGNGPLSS